MAGGSGSKLFNLGKGIEKPDTPQHRYHCTPPSHNSSKHDEHPVPQYLLPPIYRLSKLLVLNPERNHERWRTRLVSSLRSRALFSRNENEMQSRNKNKMRTTSPLPTRAASSLRTRADPRGPFANSLNLTMGPNTNQPTYQPTNQPTNQPTTQPPNHPLYQLQHHPNSSWNHPGAGLLSLKDVMQVEKGVLLPNLNFCAKICNTVPS